MPLTEKGKEIKGAMTKEYGSKKGEQVFYASKNKGTITGVDAQQSTATPGHHDPEEKKPASEPAARVDAHTAYMDAMKRGFKK